MILNNCLSTSCWGSSRESVCTCKMKYRLQVYSVRENIHILHTYNDRRIQLTVVNEKKSLKHPTLFFRKKLFNGITKQKCIYMTTIQKASNWQCQFNQIQEINLFATLGKKIHQKTYKLLYIRGFTLLIRENNYETAVIYMNPRCHLLVRWRQLLIRWKN